jgi:glutamate racemase
MGDQVTLIDPALETVAQVQEILRGIEGLNRSQAGCIEHQFYSTGSPDSFLRVGQLMVGNLVQKVEQVDLESRD